MNSWTFIQASYLEISFATSAQHWKPYARKEFNILLVWVITPPLETILEIQLLISPSGLFKIQAVNQQLMLYISSQPPAIYKTREQLHARKINDGLLRGIQKLTSASFYLTGKESCFSSTAVVNKQVSLVKQKNMGIFLRRISEWWESQGKDEGASWHSGGIRWHLYNGWQLSTMPTPHKLSCNIWQNRNSKHQNIQRNIGSWKQNKNQVQVVLVLQP